MPYTVAPFSHRGYTLLCVGMCVIMEKHGPPTAFVAGTNAAAVLTTCQVRKNVHSPTHECWDRLWSGRGSDRGHVEASRDQSLAGVYKMVCKWCKIYIPRTVCCCLLNLTNCYIFFTQTNANRQNDSWIHTHTHTHRAKTSPADALPAGGTLHRQGPTWIIFRHTALHLLLDISYLLCLCLHSSSPQVCLKSQSWCKAGSLAMMKKKFRLAIEGIHLSLGSASSHEPTQISVQSTKSVKGKVEHIPPPRRQLS